MLLKHSAKSLSRILLSDKQKMRKLCNQPLWWHAFTHFLTKQFLFFLANVALVVLSIFQLLMSCARPITSKLSLYWKVELMFSLSKPFLTPPMLRQRFMQSRNCLNSGLLYQSLWVLFTLFCYFSVVNRLSTFLVRFLEQLSTKAAALSLDKRQMPLWQVFLIPTLFGELHVNISFLIPSKLLSSSARIWIMMCFFLRQICVKNCW